MDQPVKFFIPLEVYKLNTTFETRNRSRFIQPFPRSYLKSAIYVIFSRWSSIELERCI